ncbi:MAG: hypothetical protein ACRDFB_09270 [Rhabdochlamydiaceae bacterium]
MIKTIDYYPPKEVKSLFYKKVKTLRQRYGRKDLDEDNSNSRQGEIPNPPEKPMK